MEQIERRQFFQGLVAGGASISTRAEGRNRRTHHQGERVYHGPMAIPERVASIIAGHPAIKRTTDRHLVSRYAEDGWTWLFRCQVPAHRLMVGEIVRTPEGRMRVHLWSAADPTRYTRGDEPAAIVAAKQQSPASLMPPLPYTAPDLTWGDLDADSLRDILPYEEIAHTTQS